MRLAAFKMPIKTKFIMREAEELVTNGTLQDE
jgi:ribosomal protein L16/L10AE